MKRTKSIEPIDRIVFVISYWKLFRELQGVTFDYLNVKEKYLFSLLSAFRCQVEKFQTLILDIINQSL